MVERSLYDSTDPCAARRACRERAASVPATCATGGDPTWDVHIVDEDGHDRGWVALPWVAR